MQVARLPDTASSRFLAGKWIRSLRHCLHVFERFTERARQVVVLAQDEARLLGHDHVGTEHLLLGLVREEEGVAARTLQSLGVELSKVRTAVEFIIGRNKD